MKKENEIIDKVRIFRVCFLQVSFLSISLENVTGNFYFSALLCACQQKNTTQSTLGDSEPHKPFYHVEYAHISYLIRMHSASLF